MSRSLLALLLVTLVPACRTSLEDESGTAQVDAGPMPPSPSCMEAAAELTPTATFLYDNTFKRNCTGSSCHDSSTPAANLDLSSAVIARASLVDVNATEDDYITDMKLVVPGQPTQSYLMLRVKHFTPDQMDPPQQAVPSSDELDFYMPQDLRAGLCEGKRGAIERWIVNGAPL